MCMCRALIADSLKCIGISFVTQVSELKGQLNQVARSGSSTSNNILMRSAMMSPSTAASQYDEKHRSVLKKIEKDRKEAQEVRKKNTRASVRKQLTEAMPMKNCDSGNVHGYILLECSTKTMTEAMSVVKF